ncbi:hypothetical protein GF420_13230 [candidate division GN15 bacterium]|nr:hypothetical protein [candidate division GN15 bacterium]
MTRGTLSRGWLASIVIAYAVIGLSLLIASYPNTRFTEETLIYDLIRLDIWALSFVGLLVAVYLSRLSERARSWLMVLGCSVWGMVTVALFFHGTPFGLNGYGGDQAFRIAMILKFKTFVLPGDFYYRDLPPFYPPVLYWLLGMLARIVGANAFLMVKLGTELLYLVSPIVCFLLWRRLVTPLQAALVAISTIVFVSFGKAAPLVAPHAFLANSLFIPWWFYYVEQVRVVRVDRQHYLVGGVIGALIFMTYYYPFFIGGLLLAVRLLLGKRVSGLAPARGHFRWSPAIILLGLAALFSSAFWGPLLWSFVTIGYDSAQQEWHHMASPGIGFQFVQFSLAGVLYFVALLVAVRRRHAPVYRGFLALAAMVLVFHLLGSILGAIDKPVNLIKAGEFIALAGGPLLGLVAAAMLRRSRRGARRTWVGAAAVLLVLIACLHQVNGFAKQPTVRTARTTGVPEWGLDADAMAERRGSVFLTINEKLFTFYPVYTFFAINEHYSHPAARLEDRLDLLEHLQRVTDPYIFNLALRENRYDRVDFFMPGLSDGRWELVAARSNYPNKYRHVYFHFDTTLTTDSTLFRRQKHERLFAVLAPARRPESSDDFGPRRELLNAIARHLTDSGREALSRYANLSL